MTEQPEPEVGAGAARDRLTRWRLVLGGNEADGLSGAGGTPVSLSAADERRDLGRPRSRLGGDGVGRDDEPPGQRRLEQRQLVADAAQHLGEPDVQGPADRGEQLRGGFLLATLNLAQIAE